MSEWKKVEGTDRGDVKLYALSTCVWCKRTKRLLDKLGVSYRYIDVDTLSRERRKEIEEEEVSRWNPRCSYPTLVFNEASCVLGLDEDKIKSELGV